MIKTFLIIFLHLFRSFSWANSIDQNFDIDREIRIAETLNAKVASLQFHSYLEKKLELITQAKQAIEFSQQVSSSQLRQVCNPGREGKVLSEKNGVYKKQRCIEREALVWELSVLLGCDRFIAPSIPIPIYGDWATFQPFISHLHSHARFFPKNSPARAPLSQADYWIISIFCFLIGHSDLNGDNLHYTPAGYMLVDNDCSFPSQNFPTFEVNHLAVPLTNAFVDLDRAEFPLNKRDLATVSQFLAELRGLKTDIETYCALTPLSKALDEQCFRAF